MKTSLLTGLCLIGCILAGCKSTKNITPDAFEGRQIRLGSGGGFTGYITQWALLESGRLWGVSGEPTASLQHIGKLKKRLTQDLLQNANNTLDMYAGTNEPGNMYRFLEVHGPEGVTKMVWDPSQQKLYGQLNEVFESFQAAVKTQGPVPSAGESDSPGNEP